MPACVQQAGCLKTSIKIGPPGLVPASTVSFVCLQVYDKLAGSGNSRFGRICLFRPSPQDLETAAREQKTFDRRRVLKRKHFQDLARAVYARVLVFRGRRICLFAGGGSLAAKFLMKIPIIRQASNVVTNTIMVGLVGPLAGVVLAVRL
jgi:hypothetical protein